MPNYSPPVSTGGTVTVGTAAAALLAGTLYDPAIAVSKATTSLLAQTALDTTNLRLTFTAPANGIVLVKARGVTIGATSSPMVLWGVLDGATVKARQVGLSGHLGASAQAARMEACSMLVTGLTPGQSYTWDLSYGVEFAVASTNIKYGGPDDASTSNAWGGISYEVWDTPALLAGTMYDPGTAATAAVTSGLAMTALDTTNLRLTFTAPTTGNVRVRLRGVISGTTGLGQSTHFGVLDGATVKGRSRGLGGYGVNASAVATDDWVNESEFVVTGLVSGQSYTWDAAYSVDNTQASGAVKWGGPDNTTQDDAWGGFVFEVWRA